MTTAAEGTAAIRAAASSTVAGPWDFTGLADLQVAVDGGSTDTILVSAGTWGAIDAVTADEVVTWLNAALLSSATASASKSSRTAPANDVVTIKSNTKGSGSTVQILASDVATALGIAADTYVPEESVYYPENDFRVRTDPVDEDPRITRNAEDFDYALDDVAGLEPGTYTVWVEAGAMPPMSWAKLNFQVGTATEEAPVATNCNDCHEGTTMHASFFAVEFDTDICKSCHDYERQLLGQVGWAAANNGFGSAPLARRVHGVHRGKYLAAPEEVHQSVDYSHVVFPQDIRNCTKCHADNPSWMDGASRLACLSCHDSEDAKTHGLLNTLDPTPEDHWSGDEVESCGACHGADREFAPAEVHNISDPYVPPYPR